MSAEDSNYKLIYFAARGLAEPIRLILHFKGIPFEDFRITWEDRETLWPEIKSKMPFGTVPVLEFDHFDGNNSKRQQIGQSHTICRYLGKKLGLAGQNDLEQAKVDELGEWVKDIWAKYFPYYIVGIGYEKGDKEKLRNEIFTPLFEQQFLPIFMAKLQKSTSLFILPFGLTWMDFIFAEILTTFDYMEKGEIFARHKELGEYANRVYGANEAIKIYVQNRPTMETLLRGVGQRA